MPQTFKLSEDGHILFHTMQDPIDMEDIWKTFPIQKRYFDEASQTLHVLIDITNWHRLPSGVLKARTSPELKHQNSGHLAVVGAAPFARSMAEAMFQIAHYKRAVFFDTTEEALSYLYQIIQVE